MRFGHRQFPRHQTHGFSGSDVIGVEQGRGFSEINRPAAAAWKKSTEAFEPFEGDRGRGFSENEALKNSPASSVEPWQARATSLEHTGLPREWAEPFAKLLCGPPPGDFDHAY